jgi:hypothetical protein
MDSFTKPLRGKKQEARSKKQEARNMLFCFLLVSCFWSGDGRVGILFLGSIFEGEEVKNARRGGTV